LTVVSDSWFGIIYGVRKRHTLSVALAIIGVLVVAVIMLGFTALV